MLNEIVSIDGDAFTLTQEEIDAGFWLAFLLNWEITGETCH